MLNEQQKESRLLLVLSVAFQVVILLTMTALSARPLLVGGTGLLRVIPVDPRDTFRGDYMILGYQGIDRNLPAGPAEKTSWQLPVYLPLTRESDGKHWRPGKVTYVKPTGGTFLRGTRQTSGEVKYGIEAFYIQNRTGSDYEKALKEKRLSAEIALTADGQAAVKQLVIEK